MSELSLEAKQIVEKASKSNYGFIIYSIEYNSSYILIGDEILKEFEYNNHKLKELWLFALQELCNNKFIERYNCNDCIEIYRLISKKQLIRD